MAATTVGLKKLRQTQLVIEATKGTDLAATHLWLGDVYVESLDKVENEQYNIGVPGAGGIPEHSFISETGTRFVFADKPASVEEIAYVLQSIKKAVTSQAISPFLLDTFAFPTDNTANDFGTFTVEAGDGIQAYDASYGIFTKLQIKSDRGSNNGKVMMNAEMLARKRAAASLTASLAAISNIEPLHIHNSTFYIDALGGTIGTTPISNFLIAYEINVDFGLIPDPSASGRASKDFGQGLYNGNFLVNGNFVCKMTADAVTQIANARTPTGILAQLKIVGTGTRSLKCNLPLHWTKDPDWGRADREGIHIVQFDWEAGYSTTATAQGISFPLNLSASTTLT